MSTFIVTVKHRTNKYDVEVDPESTGLDFKLQLYSLTMVEPSRQKVIAKGAILKDDAVIKNSNIKPGVSVMLMGTPSDDNAGALVRPKEPIKFLEDLGDEALASLGLPRGIRNLGNTCYLNSTLQVLNSIPELVNKMPGPAPSTSDIASRRLYTEIQALFNMLKLGKEVPVPAQFLAALRAVYPQFAERSKSGPGYAQQDAEEAYTQILQFLKQNSPAGSVSSVIDKYMGGTLKTWIRCEEEGEDAEVVEGEEDFNKLSCHITSSTNHLQDGLKASMTEELEKRSERLGRDAKFTKTVQISRLPKYLTVHFVRFFWKRGSQKKAKIMRKVTFPSELDLMEFCTPELKKVLIPVRDKVREVRKDELDFERSRKRRKVIADKKEASAASSLSASASAPAPAADADVAMVDGEQFKTDADIDAENEAALKKAKDELKALLNPEQFADDGANQTGIYELRGIVTHQGASADSGHYTAYVKKDPVVDPKTGKAEDDGSWWWFNDDKVSEVPGEKIEGLSGGGETHSALVLLYRAVPVPLNEK